MYSNCFRSGIAFALLTAVWLTDTLPDYSLIVILHSYLHFQGGARSLILGVTI